MVENAVEELLVLRDFNHDGQLDLDEFVGVLEQVYKALYTTAPPHSPTRTHTDRVRKTNRHTFANETKQERSANRTISAKFPRNSPR